MRAAIGIASVAAIVSCGIAAAVGCSSSDASPSSDGDTASDASCATLVDASPPATGDDAAGDVAIVDASDAGAIADASDAAPAHDAATPLVCAPEAFVPTYKSSAIQTVCSSGDFATIMGACFGNNGGSCQQACSAAPTCCDCIFPPNSAPNAGPFVFTPHRTFVNYGGCVGLHLGSEAPSCGSALGDFNQCIEGSCDGCWTADAGALDGGLVAAYSQCASAATAGPCATYDDQWRQYCPTHSSAFDDCRAQQNDTFFSYATRVAAYFCAAF